MGALWTLVIVTLLACADPQVREVLYYVDKDTCEEAATRLVYYLEPGEHFECREKK
jgi:hypothetical protein